MSDLAGKKLLILGANPETVPLIKKANNLDVHTIVTDYTPGAFAKQFACESYDIDGFDVNALVNLGRRLMVDGVLVGVADRLIVPYQQVCDRLGLPCYGTQEQCAILTDKMRFGQECQKFGISGIPTYHLDAKLAPEDLEKLQYPVLIKPADGNSGQGLTVCHQEADVQTAVEKALKHSRSRRFLVERYMTCDDIFIFYTFIEGQCWPSIIADRFTCKDQMDKNPVCLGAVSPSKYAGLYYKNMHHKMVRMFKSMGLKNGVLMVSAFVEGERFYVYDPGFRLQGEAPNLTVQKMTGIDQLAMLVRFALTGENPLFSCGSFPDCRSWNRYACTIWYLLRQGKIAEISGMDLVEKDEDVFAVVQRLKSGDTVTAEMQGTERQVLARVYLACDSLAKLKSKVLKLQHTIEVKSEDGESMLLAGFNVDKIACKTKEGYD